MKELTKAEEQVMQYLWRIEKGYMKDIIAQFPEPRPAYTTVATVIKVLVNKGFIAFHANGKLREYYPAVAKNDYSKGLLRKWASNFYEGSKSAVFSFFMKEKDMNLSELESLRKMLDEQIEKKKGENE